MYSNFDLFLCIIESVCGYTRPRDVYKMQAEFQLQFVSLLEANNGFSTTIHVAVI